MTSGQKAIIFDNTGKQIDEIYINPGQRILEINTAAYNSGIYMLSLPGENEAIIKRFIVSHR